MAIFAAGMGERRWSGIFFENPLFIRNLELLHELLQDHLIHLRSTGVSDCMLSFR